MSVPFTPVDGCGCEGWCHECARVGCAMCLAETDRQRPWHRNAWRRLARLGTHKERADG